MADFSICENMARMIIKSRIGDTNPSEDDIQNAIDEVAKLMPMEASEKTYVEELATGEL